MINVFSLVKPSEMPLLHQLLCYVSTVKQKTDIHIYNKELLSSGELQTFKAMIKMSYTKGTNPFAQALRQGKQNG